MMGEKGTEGLRKVGKEKVIEIGGIIAKGPESVVYNGRFDDRKVAVKLILTANKDLSKELEVLRKVEHKNVVKYLFKDTCEAGQSLYIVLAMCKYTLQQFINENLPEVILETYEILRQTTEGLDYLHNTKDLIHRDLKPSNILLINEDNKWTVKISDFGISTQLTPGETSKTVRSQKGTIGYIAPEILKGLRVSKKADIFSLGIVYFYVVSGGEHPYDQGSYTIERNISDEAYTPTLDAIKADYVSDLKTLISHMIQHKQKDRPSVSHVKAHHIFWNKERSLTFLEDVSNFLNNQQTHQKVINELEKGVDEDSGENWREKLLKNNAGTEVARVVSEHNANKNKILDLLRLIRNWKSHFHDKKTSKQFQQEFGDLPEGLLIFFTSKFPKLLAHVYDVMWSQSSEPALKKYYYMMVPESLPESSKDSDTSKAAVIEKVMLTEEPMDVDYAEGTDVLKVDTTSRKRTHDGELCVESIVLRKYQRELAQQALAGNNSMIIAPTGSGKTVVAYAIIRNQLIKCKEKHVMFIVSKSTLAQQQYKFFARHLREYSVTYITGNEAVEIDAGLLIQEHCLAVLTPQILINELKSTPPSITFDRISLMIFDECHHATKKHPYKALMDMLLDAKKESCQDPCKIQIVGLTASPGVGKAGRDRVERKLLSLLAGLNITTFPVTVTESLAELEEHQHKIEHIFVLNVRRMNSQKSY